MAVAFDAGSEGEGATGLTVSHIVGAGSNRILYASVSHCPGSGADVDAVSATYGGVSPTGTFFTDITTSGNRHTRVFYWLAPTSGTANLVFTWAGGGNMRAIGASFSGVDQTTPHDAQQTFDGTGGTTTPSVNVTSAAGNMVMDVCVCGSGATFTSGQTLINDMTGDGGGPGYNSHASSYASGSGTVSMSYTLSTTVSVVLWAWDINASGGGGASRPMFRGS